MIGRLAPHTSNASVEHLLEARPEVDIEEDLEWAEFLPSGALEYLGPWNLEPVVSTAGGCQSPGPPDGPVAG